MTSRFTELVVDRHDPERLAALWCAVLDFRVLDRGEKMVEIGSWGNEFDVVRTLAATAHAMPAA
ncbi:hypothetical protein SAMN05216483_0461 [Streptomyces sp. 2131.1]|nr:hypothetical protein SAMN05216483_0461 [Streptomyces sp. 2131.1]